MAPFQLDDMRGALHAIEEELLRQMKLVEERSNEPLERRQNMLSNALWDLDYALERGRFGVQREVCTDSGESTTFSPGCAPLERLPVELQKMIMEHVLDFTCAPAAESIDAVETYDYFGLTLGYKNKASIIFTPLEPVFGKERYNILSIKFISVKHFCAPRLISKTLLAPATEAMLGRANITEGQPSPKSLLRPNSKIGERNRFWDNDLFFRYGGADALDYFKANLNRPTYVERFAMRNDCLPAVAPLTAGPAPFPRDFCDLFECLAEGKKTLTVPFMVVRKVFVHEVEQPPCKHLGVVSFRGNSRDIIIQRRPWLGVGSCDPSFPRPCLDPYNRTRCLATRDVDDDLVDARKTDAELENGDWSDELLQRHWAYIQYDATWADRFESDLKLLLAKDAVGVWADKWTVDP
ncbi:hypothetical protein LTR81_018200 [Elasticomyces elasticus]